MAKQKIKILKHEVNEVVNGGKKNMAKNKIPEKGYDRVKRNIDFNHFRKHQRSTSKRRIKK